MKQRIPKLLRKKTPEITLTGLLDSHGTTVPTDGASGYETGCLFRHTDGGDGTALYVNEGSVSSCDFNAITVA
jgi:hypothetical protein